MKPQSQPKSPSFFSGLLKKPWFFAVLYLGLIPAFAIAYTTIGKEFYQSTIRLEESYGVDIANLKKDFGRQIVANYIKRGGSKTIGGDKGRWEMDKAFVDGISFTEGSGIMRFSIGIPYVETAKNNPRSHEFLSQCRLDANYYSSYSGLYYDDDGKPIFSGGSELNIDIEDIPKDMPISVLFAEQMEYDKKVLIHVPDELVAAIHSLKDASNGNSLGLSKRYGRMVYFSAVTITTVGYGDIVPISDVARWLVALEAILGILVAGCFLNALANKIASNFPHPTDETFPLAPHER